MIPFTIEQLVTMRAAMEEAKIEADRIRMKALQQLKKYEELKKLFTDALEVNENAIETEDDFRNALAQDEALNPCNFCGEAHCPLGRDHSEEQREIVGMY